MDLKPGEVLVTSSVIVVARMAGGAGGIGVTSTTVECECTKAEPNTPDCKPKTKTFPGGVVVYCKMMRGCKECKQTVTTTNTGFAIA